MPGAAVYITVFALVTVLIDHIAVAVVAYRTHTLLSLRPDTQLTACVVSTLYVVPGYHAYGNVVRFTQRMML